MEKTGFELLKTRKLGDTPSIAALEKQYGLRLPPLYRLFANTFVLGDFKESFNIERIFIEEKNDYFPGRFYYYPYGKGERDIGFTNFDVLESVFELWEEDKDEDEEVLIKLGGLQIGYLALGGGIYVGLKKKNLDKVFLYLWDKDEVVLLADNVFEFVQGLKLDDDDILPNGIKHSDLYKNWGEDFWRIKKP